MDIRTGELSQAWFRFFLAIWERSGGAIGVLGVPGGISGNVQFNQNGAFGGLTNTQLSALINIFTAGLSGAVPASGGGSVKFLRADAVFALIDLAADVTGRLPFANLGTLAGSSLFGNPAVSAGDGTSVSVGSGLTLTVGGTLSATGAGTGTVTKVDTGALLAGGPITTTGTISVAAITATSLIANSTTASAVPTAVPIGSGLSFTSGTLVVTSSGGSVTKVDTGALLTGGPITTTGTISIAAIAATSLIANATGGAAVPTAVPIGTGLAFSAGTLTASGGAGETIIASGISLTSNPAVVPFIVGRSVPAAAAFTLVNAHGATIVDNANGPLVWSCATAGLGTNGLTTAQWPVPVGNWTYTMHAKFFGGVGVLPLVGLSDGTKYDLFEFQGLVASSDGYVFAFQTWTSVTLNASSTLRDLGWAPEWFRFTWNAGTTTRTLQLSPDGFTWYVISTTASPFLTPSQFVFGANLGVNNANVPVTISVDYLVQT